VDVRYGLLAGSPLGNNVLDAFEALDLVATVDTTTSVVYPNGSDLGAALKDSAALIKGNIGVRVVAISIGGWDHHTNLVAQLAPLGAELSGCLKAFHDDLGSDLGRPLTLVMTEFGRRIDENGGDGTDHGHGGVMMAMGGGIAGGRVIVKDGVWPGLVPADRFIGEDRRSTTDFRDVFAEALNRHMGLAVSGMGPVFGLLGQRVEVPGAVRVADLFRAWACAPVRCRIRTAGDGRPGSAYCVLHQIVIRYGVPTITCKVSPELNARLSATSRARRTTKSVVVREILEAQLSRRSVRKQLRAYDLVKHLVGRLSGPRDLSHHARHMADFGE
jgi:hypothetical protein